MVTATVGERVQMPLSQLRVSDQSNQELLTICEQRLYLDVDSRRHLNDESYQAAGNKDDRLSTFDRTLTKIFSATDDPEFRAYFELLDTMDAARLAPAESADGVEPPSAFALAWARTILRQFQVEALKPTRVAASVEGGIAISFVNSNKYSDIECFHSGEILAVTSNRQDERVVWEVDESASGIAAACARVRKFINPAAGQNDAKRPTYRQQLSPA